MLPAFLSRNPAPWRGRSPRGFALAALCTLLVGCATAPLPDLHAPAPAQWRHAAADAAGAAPVDLHGWWHAFGDPQLDALVDKALARNLDVAQAVERLRAARNLHRKVGARYLPQLHARTEDAFDPDASASFFLAGFDALWELDFFGRGAADKRMTRGDLEAAAADLRGARVSLVAEVARDWLDLRAAQQQVLWLERIRDARRGQWDVAQARQRLRLASALDVEQARATLAQAEAALAEPRQAVDANAQQLAILLGQAEPDPAWLQAGPMPSLGPWRLESAPADLLRSRPEILRAEAEVLHAAGEAGMAHANQYPSLALGGSLTWSTGLLSHRPTNDNAILSLGPLIDIPLFDWGMRRAQAHAKEHELRASVLAYRQSVLQGVAEVETALGQLKQQADYESRCADAASALEKADAAVEQRVALRLAGPADRADSTIARDQAALALAQARASRGLAFVALFKALGGAPLPARDQGALAKGHD
ncbi:MAG TPA: efflux transporter outer membrane subunit [Frateuria sp.]|uniref:efflux transporter outer membrane subunit n=1 Tax=Frateuria sp. TaxID=2211372 RepID=UPI002DF0F59E|nr:efflux transporter outer membrane subunit [Frateuria sp.]